MRSDIVAGAVFPDYELSDHTTKRRRLSELQGQHPMVLVLSRGGYCPKDRRQHEGLVQLHREIEVGYCRLVTVSTDNITADYSNGVLTVRLAKRAEAKPKQIRVNVGQPALEGKPVASETKKGQAA